MLSVFKLANAVNEAANGSGSILQVEAYPFIGTMDEATAEFNTQLMSEAVNFMEFRAGAEEIMAEAATTNPTAIDTLSESVFATIKENVTKFFKKLIAMVKGIIEKLKAFFFKLTGKTDKWLTIMKPKIDDAKRRGGSSDATAEMHKWDIEYVTTGMKTGLGSLIDTWKSTDAHIQSLKALQNEVKAKVGPGAVGLGDKGAEADSDATKANVQSMDKNLENYKSNLDQNKAEFPGAVAKAMGVSASSSMDAVWQDVAKRANGGEKVTVKYASEIGVDKMVSAIETSKKTIDDLKKFYENHLKKLQDDHKKIDNAFTTIEVKDEDKYPTEIVRSAKACAQQLVTNVTSNYTMLETACNTARGMNVRYVQDMTSEFMSVLTKFAGIKSKK